MLNLLLLDSFTEQSENDPFEKDQRYAWGLIICPAVRDGDVSVYARQYYLAGIISNSKAKYQAGLNLVRGAILTIC